MSNYTLELQLKDEEGIVVWQGQLPIEIVAQLAFGEGEYGAGSYGGTETQ